MSFSRHVFSATFLFGLALSLTGGLVCYAQSDPKPQPVQPGSQTPQPQQAQDTKSPTVGDLQKQLDDMRNYLKDQQQNESDFGLVIGVGSLLVAPGVTDYQNQSNVLSAARLGKATPQLLTGISFRTRIPSLFTRFRCDIPHFPKSVPSSATATPPGQDLMPCQRVVKDKVTPVNGLTRGEIWQRNPWNAFVSIKFAPGASNPVNGFVLGGSFSIAHHLDFLVGFALTPVNEPAPGFRNVAAQFVRDQQKQGLDATFNPTAMQNNDQNAFDGFPTTNPATGALIYPGNPLTTHDRGGVVIGVSLPIAFSSFLKSSNTAPAGPSPTPASSPVK